MSYLRKTPKRTNFLGSFWKKRVPKRYSNLVSIFILGFLMILTINPALFKLKGDNRASGINGTNKLPNSQYSGNEYNVSFSAYYTNINGWLELQENWVNPLHISQTLFEADIYFKYDLSYLYFGVDFTNDTLLENGDTCTLYLDVDHDSALTSGVDLKLSVFGDSDSSYEVWNGLSFVNMTKPSGFTGASSNSSGNVQYELRIPMSSLSDPMNDTMAFAVVLDDALIPGVEISYPVDYVHILNVSAWDELNFPYADPSIDSLTISRHGGFTNASVFKFTANYVSSMNIEVDHLTVYLSGPSTLQVNLYPDNNNDHNCSDGKSYSGYPTSDLLPGRYSYHVEANDTVQVVRYPETTDLNDMWVIKMKRDHAIFDGLEYTYNYLGGIGTFRDSFSYKGGNIYSISANDNYLGTRQSVRDMDISQRNFSIADGNYPFNDHTHEWAFVRTDLNLFDHVNISILETGDVEFSVDGIKSHYVFNGQDYFTYYLTEPQGSYAYYDMQTGLLLYGYFARPGYGVLNDYTMALASTNMWENYLPPILTNISISPEAGDITNKVEFNATYIDTENNIPSYIKVRLEDDLGNISEYQLELVTGQNSTDYTAGVKYTYSNYLDGGNVTDHVKHYQTSFIAADNRWSSIYNNNTPNGYAAPNISYINLNNPVLSDYSAVPSSQAGNETLVTFYVKYTDADNNYPVLMNITINGTDYMMLKNDSSDINYMDGCVYKFSKVFSQVGTYYLNFTTFDQENSARLPSPAGTYSYTIIDQPPDIAILSPNRSFYIGTEFRIELQSNAGDLDQMWYEIYNRTDDTWVIRNVSYSGPVNVNLAPGDFMINAWANDTNGNANYTSYNFTLSMNQTFSILFIDLDNSTLESYYTSALDEIGLKYNITDTFPSLSTLSKYDLAILSTGSGSYNWSQNESILEAYLSSGGALYISGQDYLNPNSFGPTDFQRYYLGVSGMTQSISNEDLQGILLNPISDDLEFNLSSISATNYTQNSDALFLSSGTNVFALFRNTNNDILGTMNYNSSFRCVFTSFEFARVPTSELRTKILERIVYWLANSSSITIRSPLNQSYNTYDVSIYASSDDITLDSVWYNIYNYTGSSWIYTSNQSYTINTSIPITLSDGDFRLYMWTNNTWQFKAVAFTLFFRCDITPPDIVIIEPVNGSVYVDVYGDLPPVNLSGSTDIDALWFNIFNFSSGSYVWSENQSYPSGRVSLPDGLYRLDAWGNDTSGNYNNTGANATFIIDRCPVTSIDLPSGLSPYTTMTIPINFTIDDPSDLDQMWYFIERDNGGGNWVNISNNITYPGGVVYQTLSSDGTYRLWAYANDTRGTTTLYPDSRTFRIDTTGPAINVISPTNGTKNTNTITIWYTSTDSELNSMFYRIYCLDNYSYLTINNVSYGGGPVNEWLADGTYRIYMYADDYWGNIGVATAEVTVDTLPPVISGISFGDIIVNHTIDVTLTATDAGTGPSSAILHYRVYGSNQNYSIALNQTDSNTFIGILPGWNWETTLIYWGEVHDGYGRSTIGGELNFTVRGIDTSKIYTIDYTTNYSLAFLINADSSGTLNIQFLKTNPTSATIPDAIDVLSYIDISFTGNIKNVEIRFYYKFGVDLNTIKLYHFSKGIWQEVPLTESQDHTYLSANVTSLSTFVVLRTTASTGVIGDLSMTALAIILALLFALLITFSLYLSTKRKVNLDVNSKKYLDLSKEDQIIGKGKGKEKGKGKGKGKEKGKGTEGSPAYMDYSSQASLEFPETSPYEAAQKKRQKLMQKSTAQKPGSTFFVPPSKEQAAESAGPTDTVQRKVEYYCEKCKKIYIRPFDPANPEKLCPTCHSNMGIKVTCKNCGASFQVESTQYQQLIDTHIECPNCNKPLF